VGPASAAGAAQEVAGGVAPVSAVAARAGRPGGSARRERIESGYHGAGPVNVPKASRNTSVISPTVVPARAAAIRAGITLQPARVS